MNLTLKVTEEIANCTSCHAHNYTSKIKPDAKVVDHLYEMRVGGITVFICDECLDRLDGMIHNRH